MKLYLRFRSRLVEQRYSSEADQGVKGKMNANQWAVPWDLHNAAGSCSLVEVELLDGRDNLYGLYGGLYIAPFGLNEAGKNLVRGMAKFPEIQIMKIKLRFHQNIGRIPRCFSPLSQEIHLERIGNLW